MGRLLDEDDVVDWLLKRTEMYDATGHFVDENVVKKNIESQIAKIPSAQPELKWIPCSEGLPHTNGVYNVTRKISDGFECRNISDSCYYDGTNTWHDDTRVNHERRYLTDVIAWMPLPEPARLEDE